MIEASVWIMASAGASVEGADHPGGDGAVEPERRSYRDHRLSDPQAGADAEPSQRQVTCVGVQHGDVVVGVAADTFAVTVRPVDSTSRTLLAPYITWWLVST